MSEFENKEKEVLKRWKVPRFNKPPTLPSQNRFKKMKKKKSKKKFSTRKDSSYFRRGNVFRGSTNNPLPPQKLRNIVLPGAILISSSSSDDDDDFKSVEEIISSPLEKLVDRKVKKKKKTRFRIKPVKTRATYVLDTILKTSKTLLQKKKIGQLQKKNKRLEKQFSIAYIKPVKSFNELYNAKSLKRYPSLYNRKRRDIMLRRQRERKILASIRSERIKREEIEAVEKIKIEKAAAIQSKNNTWIKRTFRRYKKRFIDFERAFPQSTLNLIFSTLLVISVIYNNYTVPYVISFEKYNHFILRIFNILFDVICYLNIIKNILIKQVEYNVRLKGILAYIFSMKFLIEITCVLIPLDWIIDIPYFRLPRLLSIIMMAEYLKPLESRLEMYVNLIFFRIIKWSFFLILLIHYFSCIWFYIAKMDSNYNNFIVPTTLSNPLLYNVLMEPPIILNSAIQTYDYSYTKLKQFIGSLFFGSYYIVGFAAPFPQDLLQCIYSVFVVISGAGFFAIIIGTVSSIFNSLGKTEQIFQEKMQNIREFMKHKKVNSRIQKHINNYYNVLESTGRAIASPESVFADLDVALKRKVNLFLHRDLVKKVKIFSKMEELTNGLFIGDVCNYLKYILLLKGFTAVRYGEIGKTMYFIGSGEIDVISKEGKKVFTLKKGDLFGEIALFLKRKRTASCIASSTCELYELHRDDLFGKILKKHHQCEALFLKEARKRLIQLRRKERKERREERKRKLKEKKKKKKFVDLRKVEIETEEEKPEEIIHIQMEVVKSEEKRKKLSPRPVVKMANTSVTTTRDSNDNVKLMNEKVHDEVNNTINELLLQYNSESQNDKVKKSKSMFHLSSNK